MFNLVGEPVADAQVEIMNIGVTIDITITADGFTATQLIACSSSCNGGEDVECGVSGGTTYTGKCTQICCVSCGSKICLSACTVT